MSSLFERNEQIFDELEQAENLLEKIRIDGADKTDSEEKSALAAQLKSNVSELVANIAASGGDVEQLGGAIVLHDLVDVLERYEGVFEIPGLVERLAEVRNMIEQANG